MRVRLAKPRDKKLFLRLFKEYLESISEIPGTILPTEKNLNMIGKVFDYYVSGEWEGVVLLVAQDACLMQGEAGPQVLETSHGKIATSWGTYVREEARKNGVGMAMQERAKIMLEEMGFDTIAATIDEKNEGGWHICMEQGYELGPPAIYLDLHKKEK